MLWFVRDLFYRVGFFVTRKVDCVVVSVGNLTSGGTGKTPTIIRLAKLLSKRNYKVGVLSRGYKRQSKGYQLVTNGIEARSRWEQVGDEPFLIANKVPHVPIAVCEDRYAGAKQMRNDFHLDVLLLDDAFQHRAIARDMDIVLINSASELWEYNLLPVGTMREPMNALRRADVIVWTKANLWSPPTRALDYVSSTGKKIFESEIVITGLIGRNGKTMNLDEAKGKNAGVFCGIADPRTLRKSLLSIGIEIVHEEYFPDHAIYDSVDLTNVIEKSEAAGASLVITTEKDWIKIQEHLPSRLPVFALTIENKFDSTLEEYILGAIEKKIEEQKPRYQGSTV